MAQNLNPTGLGSFPVPGSAVAAANGGRRRHGDVNLLILEALEELVASLAPPQYRQRITFNSLAIGDTTSSVTINANSFNSFLIGLQQGVINIYQGNIFLCQVSETANPFNLYFPITPILGPFSFNVDQSSTGPAIGFIDIMQY